MQVLRMQGWKPGDALSDSEATRGVCIPNIDTAGRRQRLWAGVVEAAFGLGLLAVLLALHLSVLWRLPLFLVFWGAGVSFYQWHDHT